MLRRIAQPRIDPSRRAPEHHDGWSGLVIALIGALFWVAGARHVTEVMTTEGGTASEAQLVRAFANGGIQYPERAAAAAAPNLADPAAAAAAFERLAKQHAAAGSRQVVRVDLGAKTPCPT